MPSRFAFILFVPEVVVKLSAPPPPPSPEPDAALDSPATDAGTPAPEPAAPSAPALATWPTWFGRFDLVLAVVAVGVAFLTASFAARNSDLWLHLGTGKMLLNGQYSLGSDPLSYTAADRAWVNHSWLFDLVAYLLYRGDGFVLVFAKALVVAGTFGLLLAMRRPGQPLWPWTAFAAIAVLAAAPRYSLQPQIGSGFLLALTLYLVFRMPAPPGSWRLPIAVGVTCWFWANVDSWFFLGPLAIALLLVGALVEKQLSKGAAQPADAKPDPLGVLPNPVTLGRALLVGILACTLTPHHVRIWELPFELMGASAAAGDPRLDLVLMYPLKAEFWEKPNWGSNANGVAYAILLASGVYAIFLSAAVGRLIAPSVAVDPLPLPHAVLWIGIAILSLLTVHAIPFLAVATVPLVASRANVFSGQVVLGSSNDRRSRLLVSASGAGRFATLFVLLGLAAAAWPGFLHAPASCWWKPGIGDPAFARRVTWTAEPDAGLKRIAEWLQEARERGHLPPEERGFLASVDLANYCAWYAPHEKVFLNGRYDHHGAELREFVQARRGLGVILTAELPEFQLAADVLERHKVSYVGVGIAVGDGDRARLGVLFASNESWSSLNWSPWYFNGRASVAGWRPTLTAKTDPSFERLRIDPAEMAFGPRTDRLPAGTAKPPPLPRNVLDDFTLPLRSTPLEADEALAWLSYKFSVRRKNFIAQQAAALLRLNVPWVGMPPVAQTLFQFRDEQLARQDRLVPPPPRDGSFYTIPILAVRAARRAIAENPDHPDGYFALAQVLADPDLPINDSERKVGTIAAYRQCLSRMPPPGEYKRGAYRTPPTDVALALAQSYLNAVSPTPNSFNRGEPVDLAGLRELVGEVILVQGKQVPVRVSIHELQGAKLPPGVQPLDNGATYLLPLDLARQAVILAAEYGKDGSEQIDESNRDAFAKYLDDQRKRLDRDWQAATKSLRAANDRPGAKSRDRFRNARQANLVGEALDTLKALGAGLVEEFGAEAPGIALEMIALELAVGRVEDASANIASLKEGLDKLAAEANVNPQNIQVWRYLLRQLEYHKLVLTGDYEGAGRELESLEGRIVERNAAIKVPPPDEVLKLPVPASAFPIGIVNPLAAACWYRLHWDREYQRVRQQIAGQMDQSATFFFRRGYLCLLEGDIAGAKRRFEEVKRTAPPGWDLPDITLPMAAGYLRMIEAAEKKAAKP